MNTVFLIVVPGGANDHLRVTGYMESLASHSLLHLRVFTEHFQYASVKLGSGDRVTDQTACHPEPHTLAGRAAKLNT